jgi:serine O-acetyltransferase
LSDSNKATRKPGNPETYRKVIIWGAGSSGQTAFDLIDGKADSFVDSYSDRQSMCGLPVRRPDVLRTESGDTLVIIATVAFREVEEWLAGEAPEVAIVTVNQLIAQKLPRDSELSRLRVDLLGYFNKSWFNTWLCQPQICVNITYRICRALASGNSLWRRLLLLPARIWHTLTCAFFGIELPMTVEAGAGLQFIHYGGIIIHDNTRLGEFCRIYQNVTLGSDRRGRVPTLGSHVTMWAGSVAIGGCRLGNYTQVGANSVCLGEIDVEDVSLAGQPARPVGRRKGHIKNRRTD